MWWKDHEAYFKDQRSELSQNSNYDEKAWALNKRLISSGNIRVRGSHSGLFPIMILYPDATPYQTPHVFLLEEPLTQAEVDQVTSAPSSTNAFHLAIRKKKIYFTRHQNVEGMLCILETDDLHSEQAEVVSVGDIINRVMEWCRGTLTGEFPLDTNEFELIQHFHKHAKDLNFIISDAFFDLTIIKGDFYFEQMTALSGTLFYGAGIAGEAENGVSSYSFGSRNLLDSTLQTSAEEWFSEKKIVQEGLQAGTLIKGRWWSLNSEPNLVIDKQTFLDLFRDEAGKVSESWLRELEPLLKRASAHFFIGIRYPSRKGELEWSFFRFVRTGEASPLLDLGPLDVQELRDRIDLYDVEAIFTEDMTEEKFHIRNRGRVSRKDLKDQKITFFGLGALGSTLVLQFSKAGVGYLNLFDKDMVHAHNLVRHQASLSWITMPKTRALRGMVAEQNPFVFAREWPPCSVYLLDNESWRVLSGCQTAISSIADDNVEAYMNELAISENTTMYYVRALRGGKAARIFRVIPGTDACKECLAHYFAEGHPDFIDIPEDSALPVITNECNNPIRPASAADLELISSLTSRLVLEELQKETPGEANHWVWTTEEIEGVDYDQASPFRLHQRSLKPHSLCRLCAGTKIRSVRIYGDVAESILSQSNTAAPAETGGILVGYLKHGIMYITGASDSGPHSTECPDLFVRDNQYCQAYLDQIETETGRKIRYAGEWHSHPSAAYEPSQTDIKSLKDIANQRHYAVEEAVSIIISENKELGVTIHQKDGSYKRFAAVIVPGSYAETNPSLDPLSQAAVEKERT
ncbi:uncharacterized protein y4oA (plasmid) [Paenibacillus polymyxa M1]|uniref:ThiF family adenylyltransferase n=1 Tax=Paenibacillus polymyxa TaxID=1406 RepID=UPI00021BBB2C|nr:ThiF family adenylyltransferase [Paenibacillus polymyxa]CCC86214.1 uncharacterized protein y4oA [Paenibacillus polymyxa M1]